MDLKGQTSDYAIAAGLFLVLQKNRGRIGDFSVKSYSMSRNTPSIRPLDLDVAMEFEDGTPYTIEIKGIEYKPLTLIQRIKRFITIKRT